jgi:hypothetical protein
MVTGQNIESLVADELEDKLFEKLGYEKDPNALEGAEDFAEDEYSVPLDEDFIDPEQANAAEPYGEPEDGAQDPDAPEQVKAS